MPRPCRLELGAGLQQQFVLAEAGRQHDADRQAVVRPVQRQRGARRAAHVVGAREGREADQRSAVFLQIGVVHVLRPQRHRRPGERRAQQQVPALVEGGHLPAVAVDDAHGGRVVLDCEGAGELDRAPAHPFDLFGVDRAAACASLVAQGQADVAGDQHPDGPAEALPVPRRLCLRDLVPEVAEQRHRALDRCEAVGMHRHVGMGARLHRDAQPAGSMSEFGEEAGWRGRCRVGVARRGAMGGVQEGRRISYAAAEHVAGCEAAPAFSHQWAGRDAGPGRLQAEQAAGRGGDADGAAAVAAVGGRDDARGDRGCGAARGAAGGAFAVPGVARRAGQAGLRRGRQAELGCGRLAEDHQARPLVAFGQGGRDDARVRRHHGAVGEAVADRLPPVVVQSLRDGVDRRVDRLEALDRGVEQFLRRHQPTPDQGCQCESVVAEVVVEQRNSASECLHDHI